MKGKRQEIQEIGAWVIEDVRAVLRVLQAGPFAWSAAQWRPHKKHIEAVAKGLHPLPSWMDFWLEDMSMPEERAEIALGYAMELGLAVLDEERKGGKLVSSKVRLPEGAKGFLRGEPEATERVLKQMVYAESRYPCSGILSRYLPSDCGLVYVPEEGVRRIRSYLADLFSVLPVGEEVSLEKLTENRSRSYEPLMELIDKGLHEFETETNYQKNDAMEIELRESSLRTILEQEAVWLAGCGAVKLHPELETDSFRVELTELGRYLVTREGTFPESPNVDNAVVVKPDFEIVFVHPNPPAEARLSLFCERVHQARVGVLFRITQEALSKAAGQSIGWDSILETLLEYCPNTPSNVLRQIKDWQTSTHYAHYREAHLLELSDELQARHCASLMPKQLRYLGGSIVEVLDGKKLKTVMARLSRDGIVVR